MKRSLLSITILLFSRFLFAQELPRADFENTFYMLPLFEHIRVSGMLTFQEKEEQMLKMKNELGPGNLYHSLGFSFIYSPGVDGEVREVCELGRKHGLHAGLIFALQSHTRNDYRHVANTDLRLYQWRLDGVDWKGAFTTSGTLEVPEDERDYKIPTPSRLAQPLREYNAGKAREWAAAALKLMADYPGVVACINGPIEEELAIGGHDNIAKLADYSPYAITEFRDWLRHTGIYDASEGAYAGEGASGLIVGDLLNFNGTFRSQFYDDPTPERANGTGVSFNEFFGTQFSTWSLRYWDLDIYPEAITDEEFDCTPESGQGFCQGGFDAPRALNSRDAFWSAWSYDIPDQGGQYPAGNPDQPAFGFRQNMVRNFVRDLFDVMEDEGIPRKMMFAHQIPGEALGNFTGASGRNRSSASTVWTGYMEKSSTVGITRFGDIDPDLMLQYAGDWGIFEWHTLPNPHLSVQSLYATSISHLQKFYQNSCHMLFPGWWQPDPPAADETFPLNDSDFGRAIHDFMEGTTEVPYHMQGTEPDYTPPRVKSVSAEIRGDTSLLIQWEKRIWLDLVPTWQEWDSLDHFQVQASRDGEDWSFSDTTSGYVLEADLVDTLYRVQVRACSAQGIYGPWSNMVLSYTDTTSLSLLLDAEYESLYADPEMTNRISIRLSDPSYPIDPDSVSITITGEGSNQNTTPTDADSIEMFWPMNSESEVGGTHGMEEVEIAGGILSASVSTDEPVDPYFYLTGSSLDGSALPHIAFRLYSSIPTSGQFYWFTDDGHRSTAYEIKKGWQVYHLDSLAEWISFDQINQFRLDPGTTGGAKIKLDWLAVSSKKISGELVGDITIGDQEISVLTSPTANPGSYTVTIGVGSLVDSITVYTDTVNQHPLVNLLLPGKDTVLEQGYSIDVQAEASDPDGQLELLSLMIGDSIFHSSYGNDCSLNWKPEMEGTYSIYAEAIDNAGDTVRSDSIEVVVFMQEAYGGLPYAVPGSIEAEDYDQGGSMVAYMDDDPENQGGVYRHEGVDIAAIPGETDAYYVGWTEAGEWLEYLLDVPDGKKYEVLVLAASANEAGEFHLELDDRIITNHYFVEAGGDAQNYDTVKIEDLFIPEGLHKLRLFIDLGGFNLDRFEIQAYEVYILGVHEKEMEMLLYPNPARSELRVLLPDGKERVAEIWNLNGSLVRKLQLGPGTEQVLQIDDLPRGIYILNMVSDEKIIRGKFVKH
jgi:hypothetical protein